MVQPFNFDDFYQTPCIIYTFGEHDYWCNSFFPGIYPQYVFADLAHLESELEYENLFSRKILTMYFLSNSFPHNTTDRVHEMII